MNFLKAFVKYIARVITMITILMILIVVGVSIYTYSQGNKEENRLEHLNSLADKFNNNLYLGTYLNLFQKVYQETKDNTIILYKTKKAIQLESNQIDMNEYIILQNMGDKYKIYDELNKRVTQKKNIKMPDIEKIVDFDNYVEVKESYLEMIKELESLRKVNNLPYQFNNIFLMLNIMQGFDVEYDGSKPEVEKSIYDTVADFLEESWSILKWVLIILFFSAILNIMTGEKVLGFNRDTKKREPKGPLVSTLEDDEEPKPTQKIVAEDKSIKTREKKKNIRDEKEIGEVNLVIDDLTDFRDRKKKIVFKDGKYICDVNVFSSSHKANTFDELVKILEYHYAKESIIFTITKY